MIFIYFLTVGSPFFGQAFDDASHGMRGINSLDRETAWNFSGALVPSFLEFHFSSPVLPSFERLLTPTQAVANWNSITKQSRGIVPSAQLSHPREVPVSVSVCLSVSQFLAVCLFLLLTSRVTFLSSFFLFL